MFTRSLTKLPIILTAILAVPVQAQIGDSQAQVQGQTQAVPPYSQLPGYNYGYGYGAYYEFDRGLLSAVNACAYRAARANLGRVVINEVDRTSTNRFQISGRSAPYGYGPGYPPPGYYGPGTSPDYRFPPAGISFRCTADAWGRIISWNSGWR